MADDTPNDRDVPPDLSRLADRLADDRSSSPGKVRSRRGAPGKALGGALKVSSEMIAGIAVGGGAGWLLDEWLDTSPALLIICVGLGFAAGLRNVFRTAQGFGSRQPDPESDSRPHDPPSGT
ncbi:MAG: AtpZ/AtpI family protein [Rhodospirillales bacterium]|nr:AtpZ/AtpI family protein [Rhodospirillales bacterium]